MQAVCIACQPDATAVLARGHSTLNTAPVLSCKQPRGPFLAARLQTPADIVSHIRLDGSGSAD